MEQSLLGRNPPKPSAAVLAPGDVDRRTVCTAGEGSAEKLSRRLRGDLDTIVLMALRPEPERRYATVELFAEDVRRHLQGLPVRARKDTVAYRTIKFVRRNAIAVTAGTLVAAALITGVVVSTREAQIAQAQRQRAEKRFKDVRALANTLIFDVHDSIRSLSGAAESRRLLINTALRYLESLSQEAHDDPALQRELAAAFLRLGDLQGAAFEANESEFNGAQHSYRHAYALLSASLAQDPSNEQARRDIITNAGKLSDLLWYTNDPSGALSFSEQTFSHARLLLSARPGSEKSQTLLAVCEGDYAYKLFEIRRDIPRALELLQRSLATLERARAQEASVSPQSRLDRTLALMYMRAEEIYITKGDSDRALQMAQSSRRLLSQMTSTAPDNADLLHLKAFADHHVAHALLATHQLSLAKQYEQSALQVFDKLAARDANVDEYRRDAAEAGTALAVIAVEERHPEEAISLLSILEKELQKLRTETAGALDFRLTRAQVQLVLGDAYSARAAESHRTASDSATDRQLACTAYNAALAQYAPLSGQRIEAARAQQELANKLRPCSPSSH
jgi:non-specific serine/threonine protein kinase/serine/threonine-protein kinase